MGLSASVNLKQDHPQANGKLPNGAVNGTRNGHPVSVVVKDEIDKAAAVQEKSDLKKPVLSLESTPSSKPEVKFNLPIEKTNIVTTETKKTILSTPSPETSVMVPNKTPVKVHSNSKVTFSLDKEQEPKPASPFTGIFKKRNVEKVEESSELVEPKISMEETVPSKTAPPSAGPTMSTSKANDSSPEFVKQGPSPAKAPESSLPGAVINAPEEIKINIQVPSALDKNKTLEPKRTTSFLKLFKKNDVKVQEITKPSVEPEVSLPVDNAPLRTSPLADPPKLEVNNNKSKTNDAIVEPIKPEPLSTKATETLSPAVVINNPAEIQINLKVPSSPEKKKKKEPEPKPTTQFLKLFKKKNEEKIEEIVKPLQIDISTPVVEPTLQTSPPMVPPESTSPSIDSKVSTDSQVIPKADLVTESPKPGSPFLKIFNKKISEAPLHLEHSSIPIEDPPTLQVSTKDLKSEPGEKKGKDSQAPGETPAEGNGPNTETKVVPQEKSEIKITVEESKVMNFFKTFVSPTKAPKEETPAVVSTDMAKGGKEAGTKVKPEKTSATQAAAPTTESKEQDTNAKDSATGPFSKLFRQKSFKDNQQAAANGAQEVDSTASAKVPKAPPPPPELPKADVKSEPAAKNPQKEAPKDLTSTAETPPKPKPARSLTFQLFRTKETVETVQEEPQKEEEETKEEGEKSSPSKASTLEAPAQPQQPPKQDEKKKSSFTFRFKSKSQEAKKDAPPEAPPLPEAAAGTKVREEPKPSIEAEKKKGSKQEGAPKGKAPEPAVDNRSTSEASQSGDESTTGGSTKKLEKKSSLQGFFKSLGQKRHSVDAVAQTDPVTIIYPSEKAK